MKNTSKIFTLAAIAVSVMTSAAYAGSDLQQQRLADRNAAYFQGQSSSSTVTHNSDYDFANRPEQRLAARNAAYFAQSGKGEMQTQPASSANGVSQYPFPGSVPSDGGWVASSSPRKR